MEYPQRHLGIDECPQGILINLKAGGGILSFKKFQTHYFGCYPLVN